MYRAPLKTLAATACAVRVLSVGQRSRGDHQIAPIGLSHAQSNNPPQDKHDLHREYTVAADRATCYTVNCRDLGAPALSLLKRAPCREHVFFYPMSSACLTFACVISAMISASAVSVVQPISSNSHLSSRVSSASLVLVCPAVLGFHSLIISLA